MANDSTKKKKSLFEEVVSLINSSDDNKGKSTPSSGTVTTQRTPSDNNTTITRGALAGNSGGRSASNSSAQSTISVNRTSLYDSAISAIKEHYGNDEEVDDSYINTFVKDAQSFLNRSANAVNGLDWKSATSTNSYASWSNEYDSLKQRERNIRSYINKNKNTLNSSAYKEINDILDAFNKSSYEAKNAYRNAREYYSQWQTEGEYTKWKNDAEEYEAMMSYDTKTGAEEIAELEKILGEYKFLSRSMLNDRMQERLDYITTNYGDEKDIKNLIAQKKAYQTQAERLQESVRLGSVGDKDSENYDPGYDYWANVRDKNPTRDDLQAYDSMMDQSKWYTDANGKLFDAYGNEIDPYNTDEKGNIIHPSQGSVNSSDKLGIFLSATEDEVQDVTATYMNTGGTWENIVAEGSQRNWDQMEESEISTYYYYLNKEGIEAAERYLNSIQETLNHRAGTEKFKTMEDKTALELLFKAAVGFDQFNTGMQGVRNAITGNDEYIPVTATQVAGSLVQEDLGDVGRDLPDWLGGGTWAQAAGDLISTTSNMLPSILTSTVVGALNPTVGAALGTGLLSASAGGNAYTEMINLGYDKNQARTYAAMVGASEAVLQSLLGGVSKLGGGAISKGITKALGKADNVLAKLAIKFGNSALGKVIINAVEEGSEEYFQSILEPWFRNIVFGEDNEIDFRSEEALYSALLGALTGGVFEGSGVALDKVNNNAMLRDTGKAIMEADGGVDALKALAMDVSGANSKLAKQANKVSSEPATGKGLGKVAAAIKNSSNQKKVGKLYQAVESAVTTQNQTDIAKALAEKGFSKSSANNIAEAVAAKINGAELNKFQEAVLESVKYNKMVDDTVNKIVNDAESSVSKRTGDMDTYSMGIMLGKGIAPTQTIRPKFDVSDEGKTILHDTDGTARQVEVKKVSDIKNGKVSLELTDGSVVDANSISFASNGEAWTYSVLSELGVTPDQANDILSYYDGQTDVDRVSYARGVQEAYRYGSVGIPISKISSTGYAAKLTDGVRAYAYNLGAMQAVMTNANKQAANSTRKIGKGKYYNQFTQERNGVHYDDVDISKEHLNAQQKTGIQLAEFLAATGLDVHVYKSKLVDGKYDRDNGTYNAADGSIHVDLNAGNKGEGLVAYTLSHETTHFIKDWSAEKYKVFADALFEEMGKTDADIDGMVKATLERIRGMKEYKGKSEAELWDIAYDEVVAEMCETMLTDNDTAVKVAEKLKKTDSELLNKIIEFFDNLLTKLKNVLKVNMAYKDTESYSYIARQAKETIKSVERLRDLYADALVDATQTYRKAEQKNTALEDSITEAVGVKIDAETKSVAPTELKSERTWTASEYVQNREKAAVEISKKLGVSVEKALRYIDDINSVARLIADDRVRLDYEPNMDAHATVLKPNSEYKYTVDMSTLCAKRLLFTGTFDAIQKLLPNTVFDSEDIVRLREMMMQRGLEVACGICYVESTRREIGRITQEFIDRYKLAQKTGKPISRINSGGKEVTLAVRGTTFNADPNYTPTLGDLNTTDIDLVKRDHREVYDAYLAFMNARGQAKPKLLETRAEYNGEILRSFKAKSAVNARNAHGGLRLQSFSDFEVPHMIDMMQVIMDMSRVGLKSQAYTKVPAFADVFGGSGVKINLSLIAKGSGLDANGNLVFDDVEGINHQEAFRLREKYSKNVGTILVGKSDSHIIAAMADPRIDFIIPFHKSSWKESLYDALGLTGYADYTDTQNEKPIDKDRDIKNFDPSEYWDFSKTGDENAQIYLQKCREDGRIPKFPQFQGYPGYWKLLIDFKMYDNNGVGSEQEVVHPDFDMDAAEKILSEYQGGHRSFPVAKDVVEDFVNEYKANNPEQGEVRHALRGNYWYPNMQKRELREIEDIAKNSIYKDKNYVGIGVKFLYNTEKGHEYFALYSTADENDPTILYACKNSRANFEHDVILDFIEEGAGTDESSNRGSSTVNEILERNRNVPAGKNAGGNGSVGTGSNGRNASIHRRNKGRQPSEAFQACLRNITENQKQASIDERYQFAVDIEDYATAQRMVDEAAKAAGYTEEVFHGMGHRHNVYQSGHGQYGDGVYFTYDQPTARGYGKVVDHLFVKIGKIANYDDAYRALGKTDDQTLDEFANTLGFPSFDEMIDDWDNDPTDVASNPALIDMLMSRGFEGFIDDGNSGFVLWDRDGIEYRIKSADPVTYDDDGNVIPLSKRFDATNNDIRYSARDTEAVSNRELLAGALESVTEHDIELKKLQEYKAKISAMEELEAKLADINAQIKDLSFSKGPRDKAKLSALKDEKIQTQNRINIYDKQLLRLESTKALQNVLTRERNAAYQKAKAKYAKAADARVSEKLDEIRQQKATMRGYEKDLATMEREFLRIAKEYEKKSSKADSLHDALKAEAKSHKQDAALWEKEFARLMRSYDAADRKVEKLEAKIEKQRESAHNRVESHKKTEVRNKIKNFKKRLETILQRPTDRQYVPIDLINAMVDVCELINIDTDLYKADGSINKAQNRRNLTKEKLQNLKDEYEKLKTHSDPVYAGEFDEMVYTYLTELRDKYSGKHLNDMSLDELTEMYEILVAIEETLRDARKLIGWGDADGVYEAGDAIIDEQDNITQSRKNGKRNGVQKAMDASINYTLSPVRNVERMSGYNEDSYLLKLFNKFEQGIRKKNKFVMDAYKSFESLTSGKEYDDAIYKEVGGKKYEDVNGRKFGISKMQMMQAILSYERELTNGLHHIENGGFSFADLSMLRKGKLRDAISEEHSHRVSNAVNLVAEFNEALKDDKWCQDYMNASRKFFNGTAKDAINETSIILKHRIIAKDKSYIPFEVDKNFVVREISAQNDVQQTINSYGMLKEIKSGAPQALIITGLNNILDRHIEQVGNVYGLAVEVRNFNKVWNARPSNAVANDPTVKAAIQRNWGDGGVKNIEQAVQDIQGPRIRERSALYDKVKSGYIGSTFLLNLSVVTKQIGSLYSATSMLRWRDPARQIGNLIYTMAAHKKISAEVDKYTAEDRVCRMRNSTRS